MAKVVAISKGYFGGVVRYIGDQFVIPDEIWNDPKRRPGWVRMPAGAVFGGKGDHDGDGFVGGSKPNDEPKADKTEAADDAPKKRGRGKRKVDTEPFGDAPEPMTLAEAQKEIGGVRPDWVLPGDNE
jgi:hypothetical protein